MVLWAEGLRWSSFEYVISLYNNWVSGIVSYTRLLWTYGILANRLWPQVYTTELLIILWLELVWLCCTNPMDRVCALYGILKWSSLHFPLTWSSLRIPSKVIFTSLLVLPSRDALAFKIFRLHKEAENPTKGVQLLVGVPSLYSWFI